MDPSNSEMSLIDTAASQVLSMIHPLVMYTPCTDTTFLATYPEIYTLVRCADINSYETATGLSQWGQSIGLMWAYGSILGVGLFILTIFYLSWNNKELFYTATDDYQRYYQS